MLIFGLDGESDSFFRRFGEGSSGVDGVLVGLDAAALCMNFIVRSLEDIDFGTLPGVLAVALDIVNYVISIANGNKAKEIQLVVSLGRQLKLLELLIFLILLSKKLC